MITFRFTALLLLLTFNNYSYTSERSMRIAYFDMPPHMIKTANPSSPKGALVEYFEKHIAKKMGFKLKWIGPYSSFLRILEEIKANKFDAISLVTVFPGSDKVVKVSRRPIYHGQPSLAFRKDRKINEIHKDKDIIGLNIAHFKFDKKYYFKIFKQKGVHITEVTGVDWFKRSLSMLLSKRVDAVYLPETPPIKLLMKSSDLGKKLKIISLPIKKNQFFTMFNNKSHNLNEILTAYEKAVNEASITYDNFLLIYNNRKQ